MDHSHPGPEPGLGLGLGLGLRPSSSIQPAKKDLLSQSQSQNHHHLNLNHHRLSNHLNQLISIIFNPARPHKNINPNSPSHSNLLQTALNHLQLPSNDAQSLSNHPQESLSTVAEQVICYLHQLPQNHPLSPQLFTSILTRLAPLPHPKQKSDAIKFLLALAPPLPDHPSQASPSSQHQINPIDMPPIHHPHQPFPASDRAHQDSPANRLIRYRSQHARLPHLPEQLLLRDMIYLLQGIDGKFVYFKLSNSDDESWEEGGIGFNEHPDHLLITLPQRDLVLKLTELGWLYKKIDAATTLPHSMAGMVQQAFVFALKEELRLYYRSIAIIESHLSSSINSPLTLKSLLLHLTPTVLRLRMSAALISATKDMTGGQMISVLHSYTDHGDPVVHQFTSNLLEKVSVPWFKTLVSWMWDGELVDPVEEFFIKLNPGFDRDGEYQQQDPTNDGCKVWENKFSFRKEMVPTFISEVFARKIFSTGKSLNFIKHSCGDDEWQQTRSRLYQASSKSSLHYKDIAGLQQTIQSTYSIATERLFHIFFIKLRLLDHLKALKDYLLLGRGDFISLLIESLGPSLNKPANTLYRHNLTATLESAIRATTNETDLINRLDVRMLEFSSLELGWEVFMLEYKSERPLDVVLSSGAMEKYMRMFRMLWKMKRVEYVLDLGWKVVMVGASRSLRNHYWLKADFHKARLVMSEMVHFIRQLQSFCHLEVIDCGWQEFEPKLMSEGGDLDSLIEGHRRYLDRLVSKGMLLSNRAGKENTCLLLAEECFKVILAFKDSIDTLYTYALSTSLNQGSRRHHRLTDSNLNERDDSSDNESEDVEGSEQLAQIRSQISSQSKLFTDLVSDLISSLSIQHDSDMKFLAVRLNFSLFYMRLKSGGGRSGHGRK